MYCSPVCMCNVQMCETRGFCIVRLVQMCEGGKVDCSLVCGRQAVYCSVFRSESETSCVLIRSERELCAVQE